MRKFLKFAFLPVETSPWGVLTHGFFIKAPLNDKEMKKEKKVVVTYEDRNHCTTVIENPDPVRLQKLVDFFKTKKEEHLKVINMKYGGGFKYC